MACHHIAQAGLEQNSAKQAGVELVLILISASQMLDYWYAPPCHWHVCFLLSLPPLSYVVCAALGTPGGQRSASELLILVFIVVS